MRYFTIQEFMITHLKLSGNELLVYAIIFGFSQDGASLFYGSYNYIAGWLNCSQRVVINTIKKLENKGLIEKILDEGKGNKYRITDKYKTITSEKNSEVKTSTSEQNSEPTSEKNSEGSEKNSDNNNIYNYNNINNNVINNITEETSDCSQTYNLNNLEEETNGSSMVVFEEERKEKSSAKKEKKEDHRDKDVQEVIDEIRHTLEENNLIYQHDGYERVFAKHIATAKEFGSIADKFQMSRIEFAKNIIILSTSSDFWNGKIYNAKTIYKHYAKVLNDGRNTFENSKPKYDYNLNNLV